MSRKEEIEELLEIHYHRLHELRKRQAVEGLTKVDPSISIEIKSIEAEIEKLAEALAQFQKPSPGMDQLPDPLPDPEPPFGTVPLTSKFYIEREADNICWRYIANPYGATVFIQASRQVGKSSLMLRMLDRAKTECHEQYVHVDFQEFPKELFTDDEKNFLIELCAMISHELGIDEAIDHYWRRRGSNIVKCGRYLSEHILPKIETSLILAMDEVDRLAPSPFRNNFFGMLRVWHNKRAYDEQLGKLSLFLSSSTEAAHLVKNEHQSPFNVAHYVSLYDFSKEEVGELNRRYDMPLTPQQVKKLVGWVDGHPFLTRLALYQLAIGKINTQTLFSETIVDEEHFEKHLRRYMDEVFDGSEIRQMMLDICRKHTCQENHHFHRLKGAGLIKRVGEKIVPRNSLYATYFEKRLK